MRSLRSALLLLLGLLVAVAGTVVPAASFSAALSSVSGQMLATGGVPVVGAEVTLYTSDGWEHSAVDVAETDAAGTYRFSGVEAGTYRLGFVDPTGDHVTEYWSNWTTLDDADDLYVPAGADLTDRSVMVTRAGHVTGLVTGDGGVPLADVQVQAYRFSYGPGGSAWRPVAETTTDASGGYDLGGLSGGTYRLGFVDTDRVHLAEFWDDADSVTAAQDVVVREEQVTPGKDARLARGGEINGTVTGPDGPLAGASVTAYAFDAAEEEWFEIDSTRTDDAGAYRVGALPAGSYRLGFRDEESGHLAEFWDDAATVSAATSITVAAGASVAGKDAVLALGGRLAGVVTGDDGTPLDEVGVFALQQDGSQGWDFVGEAYTDASGAYELRGLPAGSYVLDFHDFSGEHVGEFWDDVSTPEEATPVAVEAGQLVTGLDPVLAFGARITGTVSAPEPLDWVWVSAYELVDGEWDYVRGTYVDEGGTYVLGGLPGGTYRLAFEDDWGPLVTEYWNDKPSLDLADDIIVAAGGTATGRDAVLVSSRTTVPTPTPTPPPASTPPPAPTPSTQPLTPDIAAQLSAIAANLRLKGKPVVGRTVKVARTVADLRTRVRYTFQWYAGAKKVTKATGSRLKVTKRLKGKVLKVRVKLSAGGAKKVVTLKVGRVR